MERVCWRLSMRVLRFRVFTRHVVKEFVRQFVVTGAGQRFCSCKMLHAPCISREMTTSTLALRFQTCMRGF